MLISRIYIRFLQSKRYDNYIFTMGLTVITQTYLFTMNLTAIRQNWLVTILSYPTRLDYISYIASVLSEPVTAYPPCLVLCVCVCVCIALDVITQTVFSFVSLFFSNSEGILWECRYLISAHDAFLELFLSGNLLAE